MRDPILGAILVQDEMIDRMAEQISKERGIKDPAEARRIKAIAYARSGNGIIDLLARKRDEIIDARIRAKEEAAHNFLVSQGWDGVDTEKAKSIRMEQSPLGKRPKKRLHPKNFCHVLVVEANLELLK